MKTRVYIVGIFMCVVLGICACSGKAERKEGAAAETSPAEKADSGRAAVPSPEKINQDPDDSPKMVLRSREEEGIDFVGIDAHVKEIHDNSLLISSDSNDFPGVFTVTCADDMPEFSDLQGGTSIQILMRKLEDKDEQGLARYKAERIIILSEDDKEAQVDILLTEAPTFVLQDVLSSRIDFTELKSGNYSWNVEEGEEGIGVIACGAAPLDEASMDFTVRLKLPEYNGMDSVAYTFSTKIAPDILEVRRWSVSDIGNNEANEESVIKYYYKSPILELEAGKVYEFAAVWKKENTGRNKFYGNASYVLVTE